jgi:mono/diheme cytochrome c family protein
MSVKFKSVGLGGLAAALTLQCMAPAQDDGLGRQAQAIFAESCYGCHGAGQQMGNLRLDTNPGKAVIPGNSAGSLLMKRITGAGGLAQMPMGGCASVHREDRRY